MRNLATSFYLMGFLICSNQIGIAQNNPDAKGSIKGVVISETGKEPIPYASILVNETKTGAVTSRDGAFLITNLPDGNYTLTISYLGFATLIIENLTIVNAGQLDIGKLSLKETSVTLNEVIVSPGSYSIMEKAAPTSQMTLSAQNIKNMAWAEDITRAVSRLPGMSSNDYSSKFAIRGGEAYQVLIALDGMELYEPFHQRDVSGGLFSVVDIEALSGVDLMTGGFTAENGNRLSGVFGMKTKRQFNDKKYTSVGLSMMYARIYTEGKFAKNKGSYLFSVRRGMLDLSLKAIGNKEYFPKFYDGLGKVEYRLNSKHILSFHLLHSGDKSFVNNSPEGDAFEQFNSTYHNTYGWATLESFYTSKLYSRTIAYAGNINHYRTGAYDKYENTDKATFSIDDYRKYTFVGIKQDWNWEAFEKLHLKAGFDVRAAMAQYDYVSAIHDLRVNADEILYNFDRDLDIHLKPSGGQLGSYVTARFKILPKLIAETGLRYDFASYTGDKNLSPRASIVYAFSKNTFLRAGWGHYYQIQFINNLDVNNGNTLFNPAELAKHYVIGFEHLFKNGISLRTEAYYKDLSNISPLWENLRDHLESYPEARNDNARVIFNGINSKGIELFIRYDQGKKISWWFSYALAKATDNVKDIEYDGLLTKRTGHVPRLNNQRHTIYADVNYRPTASWHFSASWQFYIGWPRTDYTYRYTYLPNGDVHFYAVHDVFNGTTYPAYHRLDIRVNRLFKTKKSGDFTAFVHLINVYNRQNLKKFDLDSTNDEGQLSIDSNGNYVPFEDNKYWLSFLPVLGVKWEISY